MSKKELKTTEWNFKIAKTPSMEYCLMCDAAGFLGHEKIGTGELKLGSNVVPIYPIKEIFAHLNEGSIVADIFPVYGDVDEEAIEAYNECSFMGFHLTTFDHVENTETPDIVSVDVKQSENKGTSSDVIVNSRPLKWDSVKSEYEELQNQYLHKAPNGTYLCNAYYVVRSYDITKPSTVEILIENGADIAADDYALFRIARERYPKLWVWLSERYKEVIAKNLNVIYGYDKVNQTKKDFFKAFDNFVTSMIGETDIEETDEDDEEPKESVKEGVLDKFIGFKKGFFN